MEFKFKKADVSANAVSAAKTTWFCENYPTIVRGLEVAKDFFKNPIAKMVISVAIGAVNLVGQAICVKKK